MFKVLTDPEQTVVGDAVIVGTVGSEQGAGIVIEISLKPNWFKSSKRVGVILKLDMFVAFVVLIADIVPVVVGKLVAGVITEPLWFVRVNVPSLNVS